MAVEGVSFRTEATVEQSGDAVLRKLKDFGTASANIGEEVGKLKGLNEQVNSYHAECDAFQADCEAKYKEISLGESFRELIDQLFISVFGLTIPCLGSYRGAMFRVKEVRDEIDEQVEKIMKREGRAIANLSSAPNASSAQVIEAYDALGTILPNSKVHLPGMAERLLLNGAYAKAVMLLKEYVDANDDDQRAHLQYIAALKANKQFEEARKEIEKESQNGTQSLELCLHKVDCFVGEDKLTEAKALLIDLGGHTVTYTDAVKRKVLYLNIREALERKGDLTLYKHDFLDIATSRKFLFDREIGFWLHLLASQQIVYANQEICKGVLEPIIAALKTKPEEKQLEYLKEALTTLKTDLKELKKRVTEDVPASSLSDAIKEGRKQLVQDILGGSSRPFAKPGFLPRFEMLCTIRTELGLSALEAECKEIDEIIKSIPK